MNHGLALLPVYIKRAFLQWLTWRSFAFTLVVNQVVAPLIGLAVWRAALPEDLGVSAYFVVLLIVRLMTVSYENHTFSGRIYTGDLADDLLRPHPVFIQTLGENLAIRLWHVIIGSPLLVAVAFAVPLGLQGRPLLLAIPALLFAAALQYVFTLTLAMSAFWTGRAHAIVGVGGTLVFLLGGVAIPVGFMPEHMRLAAEWLPFRSMMGFPAEVGAGFIGKEALLTGYAVQIAWLLLFAFGALFVWRRGIRKFTATGA